MKKHILLLALIFSIVGLNTVSINAQILPLREQAKLIDEVVDDRLNNLLPQLMEKTRHRYVGNDHERI